MITNHDIKEKKLLEKTFSIKENKNIVLKKAKKKEEQSLSFMAEKNARQALTQKLYETQSNLSLINKLSKNTTLDANIELIINNAYLAGKLSANFYKI